jgi:hypothetical protein
LTLPTYDYTDTLLEEVYQPRVEPYHPVVVIDFKVYAHAINKFADMVSQVAPTEEEFKQVMRAMWAYKLNRGPDMLQRFPFTAIVLDDLKGEFSEDFAEASTTGHGYWRHIEAHKLELAEYKGGRGEKTPFFYLTEAAGYEYILAKNSTFSLYSKPFFEADDIAGKVCRLKRKAKKGSVLAQREIILSTVDGDWQGLVSNTHEILWANTGPWLPRLRSEKEVCDYYLRKDKIIIKSAKGCYTVKEEVGDLGDNLYPGSPLRFFDLINEDKEWKFSAAETKSYLEKLNSTENSVREDHLLSAQRFIQSKGLFLPGFSAPTIEDKNQFFTKAIKTRAENSSPELSGRNKTLCLTIAEDKTKFKKCKKLAVDDDGLREKIKQETAVLDQCKTNQDEVCKKKSYGIIKTLKNLRADIKEKLSKLFNSP